jgi:uncharacterized membrane protein
LKGELPTLAKLIIVLCVVAVIAGFLYNAIPFSFGKDASADYKVTLYQNGTLVETFTYHIKSDHKYHDLYRNWRVPLVYIAPYNGPNIEFLSIKCSGGGIPYLSDYQGYLVLYPGPQSLGTIVNPVKTIPTSTPGVQKNEVGCYFPDGIPRGDYTVEYKFLIHPPTECHSGLCHVNLMLADQHIPYDIVNIKILDPENSIKTFYVHVPDYSVSRQQWGYLVTGRSWKNGLIEIEYVYQDNLYNLPGYKKTVSFDVLSKTESENNWYLRKYNAMKYSSQFILGVNLAFPAIAVLIYLWKGREKSYTVPEYLSYVPNKERKPWTVNLIFHGDSFTIDNNALFATILDLERRGLLELEGEKDNVIIKIKREPKDEELDRYEELVYNFVKEWSENGVLNFKELSEKAKTFDDLTKTSLYDRLNALSTTFGWMKKLAKEYVESGDKIFKVLTVSLFFAFLASPLLGSRIYDPYDEKLIVMLFILFVQPLICLLAPSQLFGRWKNDYYKEKLEWNAFRNMLKDLARIEKYTPEDLVIWKEWLIYGTALGVGEKVVEAMEKLQLTVPPGGYFVYYGPMYYHHVMKVTAPKSSGRGGGGGLGAGGGFGGGGGGVR